MSKLIEFTEEQIEAGKMLRRLGRTWEDVGKALGVSKGTARKLIEGPTPGTPRRMRPKTDPRGMRRHDLNLGEVNRPTVPEFVLAERERRLLTPRDLTSTLLGDPVPGWSALDRRR